MAFFFFSAVLAVFLLTSPCVSAMEGREEENQSSENGDKATDSGERNSDLAGAQASENGSIMSDNRPEQEPSSTKAAVDIPRVEARGWPQTSSQVYDYFDNKETPDLKNLSEKTAEAHNAAQQLNHMLERIHFHEGAKPSLLGLEKAREYARALCDRWEKEYEQYNQFLEEAKEQISTRKEKEIERFLSASYGAWQAAKDFLSETYSLSLSRLPHNSEGRVLAWTAWQEKMGTSSEADSKDEEMMPKVRAVGKYALKKEPGESSPYLRATELKERESEGFSSFSQRPPSRKESTAYAPREAQSSFVTEPQHIIDPRVTKELSAPVGSSLKLHPAVTEPPGAPRFSLRKSMASFFKPRENPVVKARKKHDSLEGALWRNRSQGLNDPDEDLTPLAPDEDEK